MVAFQCSMSCILICLWSKDLPFKVLCTPRGFFKYDYSILMWTFCFYALALLTRCILYLFHSLFNIIGLDMVGRLQPVFCYFSWMACLKVSIWYYCSELYHHSPWRIYTGSQFSYSSFTDGAYKYPCLETQFTSWNTDVKMPHHYFTMLLFPSSIIWLNFHQYCFNMHCYCFQTKFLSV